MRIHFSCATTILVLALSSMLMAIGCGTTSGGEPGDGGSAGDGGSGGNGGSPNPGFEAVTQCVSSAYQVVFRGLIEPLDPLLRYIDTPQAPPPPLRPDAPTVPQVSVLTEDEDVSGVYRRFTWLVNDVDGVSDPNEMLITVDFEETNSNLDFGIDNSQVVHIPWTIGVGTLPTWVGAGKMSVVGLGADTIRMSILPLDEGFGNDGEGPWYGGVVNICRFEVFNFQLQLDLATPDSKPFAVIVGFTGESQDYEIENGWFYFEEDDTVRFDGDAILFGAVPVEFDLTLDYGTDPAGISGTFGSTPLPANCTIDLDTFDVSC